MLRISILSFVFFALLNCRTTANSAEKSLRGQICDTSYEIHNFSVSNAFIKGLLGDQDGEFESKLLKKEYRYFPIKATYYGKNCLVIMGLCAVERDNQNKYVLKLNDNRQKQCMEYDVIVKDYKKNDYFSFEEAFSNARDPIKVKIQIDRPSAYYTELSDDSAVAARKIIYSGESSFPSAGLTASIAKYSSFPCDLSSISDSAKTLGPLSWDPTPNRLWQILEARYSLQRGAIIEVDDIQADQLDTDFSAYFNGGSHRFISGTSLSSNPNIKECSILTVQPWDSTIAAFVEEARK